MWEKKVNLENVFTLQPARPITYFGVGAIEKISDIADDLKKRGINKVVVVTGKTAYKVTGAWDKVRPVLNDKGIEYVHYDKVRANPTYESCDELASLARSENAKAFLSIGGGSQHDAAKSAAALLKYPGKTAKDLYEKIVNIEDAVPIICINTTHGTGSEVDMWAVAQSDGGYKPLIGGRGIYPIYAIEDPTLTKKLPLKQTIATSVDAVNHVFEASTTTSRNPYCTELGLRAANLVFTWLPVAIREPNNISARYWLMYASALAGISFDIAGLHITHALEHSMSALNPNTIHGIGLGALLPSVVKVTYPVLPEVCAEFFRPIIPGLKGEPGEAEYAAKRVERWLFSVGCVGKLSNIGFSENDVPKLTKNAMTSPIAKPLFGLAPVKVTEDLVKKIYTESLNPIS